MLSNWQPTATWARHQQEGSASYHRHVLPSLHEAHVAHYRVERCQQTIKVSLSDKRVGHGGSDAAQDYCNYGSARQP